MLTDFPIGGTRDAHNIVCSEHLLVTALPKFYESVTLFSLSSIIPFQRSSESARADYLKSSCRVLQMPFHKWFRRETDTNEIKCRTKGPSRRERNSGSPYQALQRNRLSRSLTIDMSKAAGADLKKLLEKRISGTY